MQKVDGLILGSDTSYLTLRKQIIALAASHRLPAIYEVRDYPDAGELMSYGTNVKDAYRVAGNYVGVSSTEKNQPTCRSCKRPSLNW
jgi:putative ABC transport system substrate-binding protein